MQSFGRSVAMFFKHRSPAALMRPSKSYQQQSQSSQHRQNNDQLPFLTRARFSALPRLHSIEEEPDNLSLFVAILYVIDLFGIFPFVTLPALFVQLGFYGIPLVISVVVLQIYTSFLLSQCWTMAELLDPSIVQKNRYPYAAIADLAYGRYCSYFVRLLLDLSIFATGIPSLVVASQNLELVVQRISDGEHAFSFCYWVIIAGLFLCPLTWLGSPRNMRGLAIFSMCVVIVIVLLLWFCLFAAKSIGKPFEGISLVTCSIAIIGSIIAAYKFGSMIAENLLESLPRSVPLYCVLILMALQLCFSAAVGSSAMFLQFDNYLKISETFSWKRIAIRSVIVAMEVLIAEFVPDFDVLIGVVGGTITGPLVFILPPLLYRRISQMERFHQRIAVEASYGSIPIDLNFEPADVDMEMEELTLNQSLSSNRIIKFFQLIWLRFVRCLYRLKCDLSVSMGVLIFGILATFISTYLNLFKISDLFRNNSGCFGNLTMMVF